MGNYNRLLSNEFSSPDHDSVIGAEEWDKIDAEFREMRDQIEKEGQEHEIGTLDY